MNKLINKKLKHFENLPFMKHKIKSSLGYYVIFCIWDQTMKVYAYIFLVSLYYCLESYMLFAFEGSL